MEIIGNVEKDLQVRPPKKYLLVKIDEDDAIKLNSAIKAFEQYDKDDKRYTVPLEELRQTIHDIWAQLHPS